MVLSAYEEERRVRIESNQELLASLGIDEDRDALTKAASAHRRPAGAVDGADGKAGNAKRGRKEVATVPEELLRRSSRRRADSTLVSLPQSWTENAADSDSDEEGGGAAATGAKKACFTQPKGRAHYVRAGEGVEEGAWGGQQEGGGVKEEEDGGSMAAIVVKEERGQQSGGAVVRRGDDSSRNLAAELHLLSNVVGRRVPGGHVKDGVMQFVSPGCRAKFSKYVGVQEWTNSIFLMLNVAAGNGYGNSFIETNGGKGMNINYFLSDRTKPDAPVVKRLAKSVVRALGDAEGAHKQPSVHLFARPAPGSAKPGNKLKLDNCDYVYLGRCKILGHKPDKSPIEFLFALEDFPSIRSTPDFEALMRLAQA